MNKYITKDDYLHYKGVDLAFEIEDDDNHSNKYDRFIHEVTEWCVNYIALEYAENDILNFQALKEFRQIRFRQGVMEQIEYILDNGWISKNTGVIKETGTMLDLGRIELSPNALREFRLGAFCNVLF